MLLIAAIACTDDTLHRQRMAVESAIKMVKTLETLAAGLAVGGLVLGIVPEGLSSLFSNYLLGPRMAADFIQTLQQMGRTEFHATVVFALLFGLGVPTLCGRPVQTMIDSHAASPLTMSLPDLLVLILLNKKEVTGHLPTQPARNLLRSLSRVLLLDGLGRLGGLPGRVTRSALSAAVAPLRSRSTRESAARVVTSSIMSLARSQRTTLLILYRLSTR